jgi:ubiquinone/menaquinone biosynthesis C-methylase UbiE
MSQDVSHGGRYTHGHEPATLASHGARTAESSAAYLLPVLTPGMSVLDVGCGPGTITLDLAEVVRPGRVVGVENVEAPLVAARDAAARRGDHSTRFGIGDALALPYDDDSFDVVHAHQVLQHLTDPVGALKEMARVCRPGGWIAARDADYAAMAWYPELPGLEEWRRVYRAAARANGAEPDAGRRVRAWATAAGLAGARLTASVWNYADRDSCRWWGNSQAERCCGTTFAEQAAEQGVTRGDLEEIAAAWRTWGESPDAWFAIVHGEILAQLSD